MIDRRRVGIMAVKLRPTREILSSAADHFTQCGDVRWTAFHTEHQWRMPRWCCNRTFVDCARHVDVGPRRSDLSSRFPHLVREIEAVAGVVEIRNAPALAPNGVVGAARRAGRIAPARSYRLVWRVALVVGLLQACYATGFIAKASCVVEGRRYFCLADDAMISMRYAANWAAGQGLVWNPGQRVEGYTNFLWTLVMGACHLPSLSPSHCCLLVQVLGLVTLWCGLVATVTLARSCRLLPTSACCAVVLAGTFYNLILFTLTGWETGVLACLVTFALARGVDALRHRQGALAPMLWLAPAVLVRQDVLPLTLFVFVFVWFCVRRGRTRLVLGLAVVAAVMAAHMVWRHHYYGDWLPNTYYLRLTGSPLANRLLPGLDQTLWTVGTLAFPLLLAATTLIRPKRWHFLLAGTFAVALLYQLYVGGDAAPTNRFVLPAALGLLVLAAEGIHRAMAALMERKTHAIGTVVRSGLTLVAVVTLNGLHWKHCLLLARPEGTSEAQANIMYAHAIDKIADPEAIVVVGWAGTFPYFSQRRCCDLLGKCDHHVARLPTRPGNDRPAHNKFDLQYTLTTYKPDIVLHWKDVSEAEALHDYRPVAVEVDGMEVLFCVRRGCPRISGGRPIGWPTFQQAHYRRPE